mgnify:CR=1 FL=1
MSENKTYNTYNPFKELQSELGHYTEDYLTLIAPKTELGRQLSGRRNRGGYIFSQRDMVDLVDLYYNSKFETGHIDSENQRKFFLNKVKFKADVAAKMTDVDNKDFLWIPGSFAKTWPTYFYARQFRDWAYDTTFGSVINQLNVDYSKFGTCVAKEAQDWINENYPPERKLL